MDMSFSTLGARIGEIADGAERRRYPRRPLSLEARVRELGTDGVEARLVDISEHGFQAESEGHFDVGTRVWLMIPGRERANALVKWIAGNRIGAEFAEPVSLDGLPSA